ncbi:hypothetical protein C2E23DRAFT_285471 [Lenzites betulinus]|nr:hypothetical protein C2E23DRAFT_285471 [Lenzites betulinus]
MYSCSTLTAPRARAEWRPSCAPTPCISPVPRLLPAPMQQPPRRPSHGLPTARCLVSRSPTWLARRPRTAPRQQGPPRSRNVGAPRATRAHRGRRTTRTQRAARREARSTGRRRTCSQRIRRYLMGCEHAHTLGSPSWGLGATASSTPSMRAKPPSARAASVVAVPDCDLVLRQGKSFDSTPAP